MIGHEPKMFWCGHIKDGQLLDCLHHLCVLHCLCSQSQIDIHHIEDKLHRLASCLK